MKDKELFEALRSNSSSERELALIFLEKACYEDLSKLFRSHYIVEDAGQIAIKKMRIIFPEEIMELNYIPPVKNWYNRSVFSEALMDEFEKNKPKGLPSLEVSMQITVFKSDKEILNFCGYIEERVKVELAFLQKRLKPEVKKVDLDEFFVNLAIELKQGKTNLIRRKLYRYFLKQWQLLDAEEAVKNLLTKQKT